MSHIDVPRTQLLISSIIATIAVVGNLVSIAMVSWQIRHRNQLETKKVEQDQINHLLAALDKPLDVALANIMDVEFLRGTDPSVLKSAESLFKARPGLVSEFRSAYQAFTNVASSVITVLPACRKRRGAAKAVDSQMKAFEKLLEELVENYNELGLRYANTAQLIVLRMVDWEKDPLQDQAFSLVAAVRHTSSAFLAELYA